MCDDEKFRDEEYSEDLPTETPFSVQEGIWFKHGRIYQDRTNQIRAFEDVIGIKLPQDFLALIGDYCQGGFDGWYQVLKGTNSSLVWMDLLLMKLPDSVDEEMDKIRESFPEHNTLITTRVMERRRHLFYQHSQLSFFPFGAASLFESKNACTNGYLAFDMSHDFKVVFLSERNPLPLPVADSFLQMMEKSVFQFFG